MTRSTRRQPQTSIRPVSNRSHRDLWRGSKKTIGLVGLYDDVDALVAAARQVRDAGRRKWDCHTPYPVHGLDDAMGLRESPIPYVTLSAGFIGLVTAIALTGGLSVFQYPIRIGGEGIIQLAGLRPDLFRAVRVVRGAGDDGLGDFLL